MRPTPIPDNEIWDGAERHVISPPGGDLTDPDIAPVEALVDVSPSTGVVNLSVRCVLEDGDLEKLAVWGAEGEAYQVFARESRHVNIHAGALHLWGRADGKPVLPDFGAFGSI